MSTLVAESGGFSETGTLWRIHRILLGQKSPQDPGILVRDRHRRPVVSPPFVQGEDPGIASRGLFTRGGTLHDGAYHRPASMDQEGAQKGVSPFGDPQKHVFSSAGVLFGHQAKIGSEMAPIFEPEGISYQSDQNRDGKNPYSGNGHELLADGMALGQTLDPGVKVFKF